jgi:hypothetical protein
LKAERFAKDLSKKIDGFSNIDDINNRLTKNKKKDDEYCIAMGLQPPRFAYYRHKRWEKLDKWGKLTNEGVDDTITQDELDYYLKANLRVPPEQRYQDRKYHWYFHELSYLDQTVVDDGNHGKAVDIIKEYGCGHESTKREKGGCCVPECRFYPKEGRIEDEEVIQEHKEFEERYRRKNAIVKIDVDLQYVEPECPSEKSENPRSDIVVLTNLLNE